MRFIPATLLDAIRCPISGQPLTLASVELLTSLNGRILRGEVFDATGASLERPLSAGLVTQDGARLFPVSPGGIPVLLERAAIEL